MAFCVSCESDCESEAGNEFVVPDFAEILVIRHGETAWNADGRIQGHMDVDLNTTGRQQAIALADRLAKEREISVVYSSDLKRARDTGSIIASRCNVPLKHLSKINKVRPDYGLLNDWSKKFNVFEDPGLRERHLGDLQGFVLHEAAELKPEAYEAYLSSRADQEIPGGGESLDQLYHRCTSSLEKIGRKHRGERVVVVTHSGVLRAFHKRAASEIVSPGKVKNASINTFHLDGEHGWTIYAWGDTSHLSKTEFLESDFGGDQTSCLFN